MTTLRRLSQRTHGQQAIVDAAKKIIIANGFESLTIRAIAKEISVTDGALYRHFKSKHEIISLLIDDIENSLLSVIEIPARFSGDPIAKLKKIFFAHVSNAEQRKGMTLIVINESFAIKDRRIKKKMLQVMSGYQEILKDVLREGIKLKKINENVDIEAAGIAFFGMVQAAVTFWALNDFKHHLKSQTLNRMFYQYVQGLCCK
jgi:AcrR family transcriptional regulator